MSETILLRVRKRRGAITASSTLRVELDAALAAADAFNDWDINTSDDDDDNDNDDNILKETRDTSAVKPNLRCHRVSMSSHCHSARSSTTSTTAIFRRIESSSFLSSHINHDTKSILKTSISFENHKRPRILDAVLLDDSESDIDDDINDDGEKTKDRCQNGIKSNGRKRRRLTLQILEPQQQQTRRRSSQLQYPILSPEQRAIDDSLRQVFAGNGNLQQHCQLINESINSALELHGTNGDEGTTLDDEDGLFWPYLWCHSEFGNWLHAAAIWNETALVRDVFDHLLENHCVQFQQVSRNDATVSYKHTADMIIREMLQTHNGDGLNPIQVAQLSGNLATQTVLEQYNNKQQQYGYFSTNGDNNMNDDDDDNHQYELYSLVVANDNGDSAQYGGDRHHERNDGEDEINNNNYNNQSVEVTNCELHNGCRGYWDERGNLILETPVTVATDADLELDDSKIDANNDNDDDNDIDSNDEDWEGNDYPDEDELNEVCSDDDDDVEDYNGFRHRNVDICRRRMVDDDDDDVYDDEEEDDAHYDPSYGDIYGQSDTLYR